MDNIEKPRRGRPPRQPQPETQLVESMGVPTPMMAPEHFKKSPGDLVKTKKEFDRVYAKQQLLDHDLFRLDVASFTRNASYNDKNPIYEQVPHIHFYHSINSRGQPQTHSSKVGGHFHKIDMLPDGSCVCGPPVIEVKTKRNGRISTEYRTSGFDNHIHEVVYKFSEKIKPQTPNLEFQKVQAKVTEIQTSREATRIDDVMDND